MKNLAIVALLFSAFVLTMSSCKKVEAPTAVDVMTSAGNATISGIAYAVLDESNADAEYAPAGTSIIVEVDPQDFPGVSTQSNNDNKMFYTATVGANGAWSVSVPAPKDPITVTVRPQDFRATYTDVLGNDLDDQIFSEGNVNVTVFEGASELVDLNYEN
jgi:hypothetical protein